MHIQALCYVLSNNTLNKKRKWTSTLIISYTNSIDGKCHHMKEREIPPL